jgi:ABC-type uncharacterized transport system substrate-binding protein
VLYREFEELRGEPFASALTLGCRGGRALRAFAMVLVVSACAAPDTSSTKPEQLARPVEIALLVSDESPAFTGVAREIVRNFPGRVGTYQLSGHDDRGGAVLGRLQASPFPVVVAIGLPAARLARRLKGKRVVFCQAFNYEDSQLVTPWMKGVAAVPPLSEQYRFWKVLSPQLKRVAVITGGNLGTLLDEAQAAAEKSQIKLVRVQVRSDKEMIYSFRRVAHDVQGLWLVPDNRVLSRDVIRELLTYSVKEGKEVMVFSPELLAPGGLLSVESDPEDIALRVIDRVAAFDVSQKVPGPAVVPLTRARVRVNAAMVARLGLTLPHELQGAVYVP